MPRCFKFVFPASSYRVFIQVCAWLLRYDRQYRELSRSFLVPMRRIQFYAVQHQRRLTTACDVGQRRFPYGTWQEEPAEVHNIDLKGGEMKALVTGSTGFVGSHLVQRLERPVAVGRSLAKIRARLGEVEARVWDPAMPVSPDLLAGVDVVFHLAGESVFSGRWNAERKERIYRSRIESTRNLVEGMASAAVRPKVLVCSSAIGFYGDRGDEIVREDSASGHDFLAGVCRDWEKEALRAEECGVRVVCIRTGVVLGADGGALMQMLPPFRFGVGGRLGSGGQYMSWIHVDDLVGIMLHAAQNVDVRGPVNGVAPEPVRNSEFTRILAAVLHRPALLPVPGFLLWLALGEFASVLLASQRVVPEKIQAAGYRFVYPRLEQALTDLLKG